MRAVRRWHICSGHWDEQVPQLLRRHVCLGHRGHVVHGVRQRHVFHRSWRIFVRNVPRCHLPLTKRRKPVRIVPGWPVLQRYGRHFVRIVPSRQVLCRTFGNTAQLSVHAVPRRLCFQHYRGYKLYCVPRGLVRPTVWAVCVHALPRGHFWLHMRSVKLSSMPRRPVHFRQRQHQLHGVSLRHLRPNFEQQLVPKLQRRLHFAAVARFGSHGLHHLPARHIQPLCWVPSVRSVRRRAVFTIFGQDVLHRVQRRVLCWHYRLVRVRRVCAWQLHQRHGIHGVQAVPRWHLLACIERKHTVCVVRRGDVRELRRQDSVHTVLGRVCAGLHLH